MPETKIGPKFDLKKLPIFSLFAQSGTGQGAGQKARLANLMGVTRNLFLLLILIAQIGSLSRQFYSSSPEEYSVTFKQSGFSDTVDKIKKDIKKMQTFFQNLEEMGKDIRSFFQKLDQTIGLFTLFFLILVVFLGRIVSFLGVPQGKGLFFTAMIMADLLLIWLHSHFALSDEFTYKLMRAHFFLLMPFILIWLIRWLKPRMKPLCKGLGRHFSGSGSAMSTQTAHETWQTLQQHIALLQQNMENSLWEQRKEKHFHLSHDLREKILDLQNDLDHLQAAQNENKKG